MRIDINGFIIIVVANNIGNNLIKLLQYCTRHSPSPQHFPTRPRIKVEVVYYLHPILLLENNISNSTNDIHCIASYISKIKMLAIIAMIIINGSSGWAVHNSIYIHIHSYTYAYILILLINYVHVS